MCPRRVYSPPLLEHKALLSCLKDMNELKGYSINQDSDQSAGAFSTMALFLHSSKTHLLHTCSVPIIVFAIGNREANHFFIILMLASLSEGSANQYVEQCL